jgi:phosphoribosylformylglycinamidine synthase
MKQKYPNDEVIAPGTVIISAGGNCTDIKVVEPVLQKTVGLFINLSQDEYKLGVLRLHKR